MAGLVFAGIAPHGFSIIAEIAGDELELFKPTRDAMEEFGEKIRAYQPETVVVLTPHGLRLKGYNAVYTCAYCRGSLSGGGQRVHAEFQCDQSMARKILEKIEEAQIPVVGANFGALSGPASNIEMDWGTLIPLWFSGARDEKKPEIVVIAPTREIPLTQLVEIGEIIARVAEASGKWVALIASADQGHAHDEKGPYGYHPASEEYDREIAKIIEENRLEDLLQMDMDWVEEAKPDSLWQMVILYGALQIVPMTGRLLSYQVPTYFGMAVATYERSKPIESLPPKLETIE